MHSGCIQKLWFCNDLLFQFLIIVFRLSVEGLEHVFAVLFGNTMNCTMNAVQMLIFIRNWPLKSAV